MVSKLAAQLALMPENEALERLVMIVQTDWQSFVASKFGPTPTLAPHVYFSIKELDGLFHEFSLWFSAKYDDNTVIEIVYECITSIFKSSFADMRSKGFVFDEAEAQKRGFKPYRTVLQ